MGRTPRASARATAPATARRLRPHPRRSSTEFQTFTTDPRGGATRLSNPHLATVLVEAAWATSHTRTWLGARYRRLHRRFGKAGGKKAAVAIAHTILVIVWHLFAHETTYTDLGADYYTQRDDPERRKNRLLRQLHDLGYDAELTRIAA